MSKNAHTDRAANQGMAKLKIIKGFTTALCYLCRFNIIGGQQAKYRLNK